MVTVSRQEEPQSVHGSPEWIREGRRTMREVARGWGKVGGGVREVWTDHAKPGSFINGVGLYPESN